MDRPTQRPSPGDVGDFLGIDKPIRPTGPGLGDRVADRRPGNDRPTTRPGDNLRDRRPQSSRDINIGDIRVGDNNVINSRVQWANIDRTKINNINNSWQNQIGGMRNWVDTHPARYARWNNWGNNVRLRWNPTRWNGCYHGDWWYNHRHPWCGWHYGYHFRRYAWNYWWTVPTFVGVTNWFAWSAPASVWQEPIYYDYGQGGNVYYEDNRVYVNGEPVASAEEFAQSAADLATVPPPESEAEAEAAEWMPLGTFAVASNENDVDPMRSIQLAVDKQGVISGTYYNDESDEAQSVQGQVDKQTQRVAFRIGEADSIVVETGLYNLTQEQAPVLVHFGADRVENWLLVRLDPPMDEEEQ